MDVIVVPLALIVWTLVVVAVATVLRLRRGRPSRRECAREELQARYARGEIDALEYRIRSRALGRDTRASAIRRAAGTGTNGAGANGAGSDRPQERRPA